MFIYSSQEKCHSVNTFFNLIMLDTVAVDYQNLDQNGLAEIHNAVDRNDLPKVKLLLSRGVKLNVRDTDYRTPLHHAAIKDVNESHYEMCKYLLERSGPYVDATDYEGETPLHLLVRKGNIKMVQLFLSFNVQVGAQDSDLKTPLFPAVSSNKNVEVIQLLIDRGLDVNQRTSYGKTLLHVACESLFNVNGSIKTIKCLLKNGANMNAFDEEGSTPVMHAIRSYGWLTKLNKEIIKKNLNFLMHHTDFNNVHPIVNILTFEYYGPLKEYLWKAILEHIAKVDSLGSPVHSSILSAIAENAEYNVYYKQCQEELQQIKNTKPPSCWITFYNILVDDGKKLKNYAGSESLIEDSKDNNWAQKFPIYGAAMADNLNKGLDRRELFDQSVSSLNNCLPIFNPTHLIMRDVIDCITNKKELSKLSGESK